MAKEHSDLYTNPRTLAQTCRHPSGLYTYIHSSTHIDDTGCSMTQINKEILVNIPLVNEGFKRIMNLL